MSGRSAYVRKQKANNHAAAHDASRSQHPYVHDVWRPEPLSPPSPLAPPHPYAGVDYDHLAEDGQPYVPALSIIDPDFGKSPVKPGFSPRGRANSAHARSGTSLSSWSSHEGYAPPARTSSKSAFRNFLDTKSDALRNKLFFRSSSRHASDRGRLSRKPSRNLMASAEARSAFAPTPAIAQAPTLAIPASPRPRTTAEQVRKSPVALSPAVESTPVPFGSARFGEHMSSVKRWVGGGKSPQPWSKLRKDPELWDPTGDTLVYFSSGSRGSGRASASLRVHSSVLEDTGSVFFATLLREGLVDDPQHDFDLPIVPSSPSSSSAPGLDSASGHNGCNSSSHSERRASDIILPLPRPRALPSMSSLQQGTGQPTPPRSESSVDDSGHPVMYELFFPAPADAPALEALRHHLTTRNVFALLFGRSLVGINFFQSLFDLHERLQMYMLPESDNTSLVIDHIVTHGLDDVRNEPASAAGLLAWSEGPLVRWYEGWREAFVHCVGMYGRLRLLPEFRDISHYTRVLLERASLETQVRVQQAAAKLIDFDFSDMWPMQSVLPPPARDSFDRFRRFLIGHYEAVFWSWPPLPRLGAVDSWLTRDVITRLRTDFTSLYDYLVDRDMTWETPTGPNDRTWRIVSKGLKPNFRADADGLPMTDMLVAFDNRCGYPHIPHPYPLLPPSQPWQLPAKQRFGKKARQMDITLTERRIALDYSEATNVFRLGPEQESNSLVDSFAQFEKTDMPCEVDPCQARKGRWILLYGILQVLATVSVDTPGLRFADRVQYFLNPPLRGTPPWRDKLEAPPQEASHEHSHCWLVPRTWEEVDHSMEPSGLRNHREIVIKGLGDGSGRSWAAINDGSHQRSLSQKSTSYTRHWLYSSDGPIDPITGDSTSPKRTALEKVTDWPIRNQPTVPIRGAAPSDYVPPDDW